MLREDLAVIKRDGRRENFDRHKMAKGLQRAISKRSIDAEQINALLSETLRRIENEYDNEYENEYENECTLDTYTILLH